ncbi:hypothetical protein MYCTH_2107812 [Thermothelomyces thermophilus ATCC 42464]|uniref:CCHC-type domain-containing protein n=1 Tax=Thermothelomyces thermophilus (strain ATCC 42464 / BCRC 31852 / DSM 1799) TaxID=573729 RepID=G2Q2X1_THET4|nr:uncharacterized protein MYCTH_2107812 [Thermothelomyces thermophilus ATCC 42464]AEO55138.1 hypothetical protein MYCTH_2107812 [Thermothelomyces thermophilus ATCC 42464]
MNRVGRMEQNFETLGFESLDSLSLTKFSEALREVLPSDKSNDRILDYYIIWLYRRLMTADLSADNDFSREIAAWYRLMKETPLADHQILQAFHGWKRSHAVEDPASSRRLSMAEAELRRLITPAASKLSGLVTDSAKSENYLSQMQLDSPKLSQEESIIIEPDDHGEDDRSDVAVLSSDTVGKKSTPPRAEDRDGHPDLSFLTGSNMLPMNEKARLSRNKREPAIGKLDGEPKTVTEDTVSHPKDKGAGVSGKPPAGYMCNRCGRKGHYFKNCPTALDPAFDWKPPKTYVCHLCKRKGQHHVSVCPLNLDPASITQQRLKHATKPGTLGGTRRADHQVCYRGDRWLPSRNRSPSPGRKARRHRGNDALRSLENFPRLGLLSTHHSRKRQISRSPSPCRIASRKKSRLAAKEVAANTVRKISGGEPIGRWKDPEEGQLSYEDEDVGQIAQPPSIKPTLRLLVNEERDAEAPNISLKERGQDEDHAESKRQWEYAVLQMIRDESLKTDLLHTNGIECPPFVHHFRGALFLNKESIWVNPTVNRARPSSAEFYGTMDEPKQRAERASYETKAEEAAKGSKETGISSEQVTNPDVIELEQTRLPSAEEGVVVVHDAEPAASMVAFLNAANSPMVAAMSLRAERLLCNEEEKESVESEASRTSTADGVCSTEKATSGAGQATTSGSSSRIMDIDDEGAKPSPPYPPILEPAIELPSTADGGLACHAQ